MPTQIYSYSLCASITLMLFFGGYFLLGKLPDRETFADFKRSRSLMGLALLTLAVNYLVHLFVQPRFINATFAICLNLSTYYLEAWLFSSALTTLLNPHYLTKRRFAMHIAGWLTYSATCALATYLLPMSVERYGVLILMGVWFGVYAFWLARRLYKTYKQAAKAFDDYSSEHIQIYIRSLSKFTYWAIVFGVGVGALTFLPDKYIPLWILSAIPFYIYLFCCYTNYQIDCEHVSAVLNAEMKDKDVEPASVAQQVTVEVAPQNRVSSVNQTEIEQKLQAWINNKRFTQKGMTIVQLSEMIDSNRTYINDYLRTKYGVSFCQWITNLRIDYSKKLMQQSSDIPISTIAESCGYNSASHFISVFKETENITPSKWKREKAVSKITILTIKMSESTKK